MHAIVMKNGHKMGDWSSYKSILKIRHPFYVIQYKTATLIHVSKFIEIKKTQEKELTLSFLETGLR